MRILKLHKKIQQEKQKEFEERVKAFVGEYRKLVRKYGCDWEAYLEAGPRGIVPGLRVINVKEKNDKGRN